MIFESTTMASIVLNPWLVCGLLVTAHFFVPGMAWGWIVPRPGKDLPGKGFSVLFAASVSLVLGFLFSLLGCLILAEAGWFTKTGETVLLCVVVLSGLLAGGIRNRPACIDHLRFSLPGLVFTLLTAMAVMILPHRGEWIAGGWDPGIYVNQGIDISRSNSLHPTPDPLFASLSPEEIDLLTRRAHNYIEALPVVPLDPETRRPEHFFFRLTPMLVAIMDRCGGLRAATRVNEITGLLLLPLFACMTWLLGRKGAYAAFALLLLIFQPVWLYHLHLPTSEMLSLFFLTAMGLLIGLRSFNRSASAAFCLLLFAAELNRFSFLPFGFLLLFFLAVLDLQVTDRAGIGRNRFFQIIALLAGAVYDYAVNPTTIGRLFEAVPALLTASLALLTITIVVDSIGTKPGIKPFLSAVVEKHGLLLQLVLILALSATPFLAEFRSNATRILPFIGTTTVTIALVGVVLLAFRESSPLKIVCVFFLAATIISLANSEIAALWPWATRRFVEYTVPLLALGGGVLLAELWSLKTRTPAPRLLAVALVALLFATNGKTCWQAWSHTEFDGLSASLAEIADQLHEGDIVVADHFRWGTPLRFLHDVAVVNGELFFEEGTPDKMAAALPVLEKMRAEGHRILFLTSTEMGLNVFPLPLTSTRLLWESDPIVLNEFVHGPKVSVFQLKDQPRQFRLYEWAP